MALIRPNNRSLQNITTLPTGITEYNLLNTDLPSGSVLQAVQSIKTSAQSTSAGGASPVAISGLSCSITPSSISNKILLTISIGYISCSGGNHMSLGVYRNDSIITDFIGDEASSRPRRTFGLGHCSGFDWEGATQTYTLLDSPNTTSEVTYSVRIGGNAGTIITINRAERDTNGTNEDGRFASTIIAMEIAG